MDPDACLAEILRLAEKQEDRGPGPDYADLVGDLDRMAELVGALDGWISGGGFLPKRWQPKPVRIVCSNTLPGDD